MRFSLFETSLIAIMVALATWSAVGVRDPLAEHRDIETGPLAGRYGPERFSAGPEEWIIRDYFGDRRGGVFLDVGAGHYRDDSNTYYLESVLGWSGLAVDAVESWADGYREHRRRTRFRAFFVSDRSGAEASIFVNPLDRRLSSGTRELPASRGLAFERRVKTTTLDHLLAAEGLTTVDFMSMDIELSEPAALAGLDLARVRPSLICIEAHYDVRQAILDYFASRGYRLLARYLRADRANLYFAPNAARW
jgi:FkbM family methyltransferase